MERVYLMIICASLVLLTTAVGLASPDVDKGVAMDRPLLLRIIPS
jgi:hypothetical protein